MPSLDEHMRRSEKRTGRDYRELNEWLDGSHASSLRRLERHLRVKKYSEYVKDMWGEEGLEEYKNHVQDDFRRFVPALGLIRKRKSSRLK